MTAIRSAPPHIMLTESVSAARRPARSAYMPNRSAPIGRAMKPPANTKAVFKSCAVWSPAGKNAREKYSAKDA